MNRECLGRGMIWSFLLVAVAHTAGAQTLDDAIDLHIEGRLDEALEAYRIVTRSAASEPVDAATAYNNACVILMNRGDFSAALEECEGAQLLLVDLGDDELRAQNFNNLGVVRQYLGHYDDAGRYFREALELDRSLDDAESEVIVLGNLGALATATGRYTDAVEFSELAEQLALQHSDEPWAREQSQVAKINRGVVLEKIGEFRGALEIYRELLDQDQDTDAWRRAALSVNVGVIYRNLGDPVRAIEAFETSIAAYETIGDSAGLSNAYLNSALAQHLNLGDVEAAERSYRRALELARLSGDRTEEIQDLFYLGALLLELERLGEAEDVFKACLRVSQESGSAEGQWSALAGLGRLMLRRGDLDDALAHLESAIDLIEGVRSDLRESSQRSGFFGDKRPIFGATIEALAQLHQQRPDDGYEERAFGVVQRAKARALLDALRANALDAGARSMEPLDLGTIGARLGGDTLLEYFLGQETAYAWAVDADGVRMVEAGPSGPLAAAVGRVHRALTEGRVPEQGLLANLSATLLAPMGSALESAGRLRIAPDGALHYLPFELLPMPGGETEVLVDSFPVSYLPSGSALEAADSLSALSNGARIAVFAGFGNPRLTDPAGLAPADTDPYTPAALLTARFSLGPLPEAERELAAARLQLRSDADVRVGAEATEGAFREAAVAGARVIHLATHAVVDEPAGGAAVLLTPSGEDDGLLFAHEVAGLEIRANLTVLGACRTGLLSPDDGLALSTLTGSFLAAGSSAVLATLWDVDDAGSATFMEQFYYELGRGAEPVDAMQRAKQRLRGDPEWNAPSVWAAYVLVGDSPAIVKRPMLPRLAWVGVALFVAAAVFSYAVRGRSGRPADRGARSLDQ